MADILTLADARAGLGWKVGQNPDRDAEILAVYIPAVTAIVESMIGRLADRREHWRSDEPSPLTTPWASASIKSVWVNGVELDSTGWSFSAPTLTITASSYTAGDEVTVFAGGLPTPAPVVLAAKIILAQMWNADKHPGVQGSVVRSESAEAVPTGFAVPRRAEALLAPYRPAGGFA